MEKQTPIVNDDLIAKFLAGEANDTESEAVNDWILDSDKNESSFFEAQKVWEKTSKTKNFRSVNTDTAWQKLHGQEAKIIALKPKFQFMRVAAAVALLFLVGLTWYFWGNQEAQQLTFSTAEKADSLLLADGSQVFANRQSKITYPKEFSGEKRAVKLEGEAFFQVKSDKEKPFIVQTKNIEIQVVGTAFNVRNDEISGETEIVVQEGKVLVRSVADSVFLTAGQQAIIHKNTILKRESIGDKNFLAYKTKRLIFEQTTLNEAVEKINHLYLSNLTLKNKALGNCLLTVSFENAKVEEIVEIIAQTLNLTVSQEDKQIFLDGKACN